MSQPWKFCRWGDKVEVFGYYWSKFPKGAYLRDADGNGSFYINHKGLKGFFSLPVLVSASDLKPWKQRENE